MNLDDSCKTHKIKRMLDVILDRNNHNNPPYLFRKKFLMVWIPVTILIYTYVYMMMDATNSYLQIDEARVLDVLFINAGILATILTVTLGVTLLGIQFRMQSYTTIGLIDYVNDKVVYGFIFVFIINIMFNVIVALQPTILPPPKSLISLVIVGTFFSLLYYIAYIYHVIYKLQQSQILNDTRKKMINAASKITKKTTSNIDAKPIRSRSSNTKYLIKHEPFEIWKDIAKKAINTDDTDLFDKNLTNMFEVIKNEKIWNKDVDLMDFLSKYIIDVMEYCSNQNRHNLEKIFIKIIDEDDILKLTNSDSQNKKDLQIASLIILNKMLKNAVKNNTQNIFTESMIILIKVISESMKKSDTYESELIADVSRNILDIMINSTKQNRYDFQMEFMNEISRVGLLTIHSDDDEFIVSWRLRVLVFLGRMLRGASENNEFISFKYSLDILTNMLENTLKNGSDNEINDAKDFTSTLFSDVMKICMEKNHHRLERSFLLSMGGKNILLVDHDDSKIVQKWRKSMLDIMMNILHKSILNNDMDFFISGLGMTTMILSNFLRKSDNEIKHIVVILSNNLQNLMKSCIEYNRHMMIATFVKHVEYGTLLLIDNNNPIIQTWRLQILEILRQIMLSAINNNDVRIFNDGMKSMGIIINNTENCTNDMKDKIGEIGSYFVVEIIKFCIEKKRVELEMIFLPKIQDILLLDCGDSDICYSSKIKMLDILEYAMSNAIKNEEEEMIMQCMNITVKILRDDSKKYPPNLRDHATSFICIQIINVIKSSIEQNHYRSAKILMKIITHTDFLMLDHEDSQIKMDWRVFMFDILYKMMQKSVENNNQDIFIDNLMVTFQMSYMIMSKCTKKEINRLITFISRHLLISMDTCVVQNRNDMLQLFIKFTETHHLPITHSDGFKITQLWQQILLSIHKNIAFYTIKNNNQRIFIETITSMFIFVDRLADVSESSIDDFFYNQINEIKKECNNYNNVGFIKFIDDKIEKI